MLLVIIGGRECDFARSETRGQHCCEWGLLDGMGFFYSCIFPNLNNEIITLGSLDNRHRERKEQE